MTAAERLNLISVEDYLAGELESPVKHEYLSGVVYAMAGANNAHNVIAGNVFAALHNRLRGKKCRPFNSDTKVRVRMPRGLRFYYPDAMVVCEPNSQEDSFQDKPVILFEVLSKKTRRVDEGEKRDAYLTIASLEAYVRLEPSAATVEVDVRSADGFERVVYRGMEAVLKLAAIGVELPLSEIYEGVTFAPERGDEELAYGLEGE